MPQFTTNGITYNRSALKQLNVKYNGRKIKFATFTKNHGFTHDEIEQIVNTQREYYHQNHPDKDIIMMCSVKYADKWRSTKYIPVDTNLQLLLDPYDDQLDHAPDRFGEFVVYVAGMNNAGGAGEHNDCLYDCLKAMVDPLPAKIKTPEKLKKFCGLARNDKVPVSKIPMIETLLKDYNINVYGDATHISTGKHVMEINILLNNGHFENYVPDDKVKIVRGISKTEKPLLVFARVSNAIVKGYDGTKFVEFNAKEFYREVKLNPLTFPYTVFPHPHGKTSKETFQLHWDTFRNEAERLKGLTDGKINLFKTGSRDALTALNYYYSTQHLITPDPIDQLEASYLEKAVCGSIMKFRHYRGPGYKYDVRSFYPSILNSLQTRFPVKKGIFTQLTDDEFQSFIHLGNFNYGIYRVKVLSNHFLFRENPTGYYTHTDLSHAISLKLKLELVHDDEPNHLHYPEHHLVNGRKLFGEYIDTLYPLKKESGRAKSILNTLWGALVQRNYYQMNFETTTDDDNIEHSINNAEIVSMFPNEENKVKIQFVKYDRYFKTSYARIKPFLVAYGRRRICTGLQLDQRIDSIQWVHTDGVIFSTPQQFRDGVLSEGLGKLKYEGFCSDCEIKNCMNIKGIFDIATKVV